MDNLTAAHQKITEGFIGQQMAVITPEKRKKLIKNAFSKLLYVTAIGYYPLAAYHDRERPKGADDYILIYCVDGKGWVEIGTEQHQLSPNTFYIIRKKTPHHYGTLGKQPWSIYWLHFTGEQADALYYRYENVTAKTSRYIAFDESRITQFNVLVDALKNNDAGDMDTEYLYIKLLSFISSFIYTGQGSEPDITDSINTTITFMKQNVQSNYQIGDLAAMANYSVSRYSELFRKRTGYAPIQYFIQLKIYKSCEYLCFTKLNIKQICHELGFDDPYYFSRIFKKHTGKSPLNYRHQYREYPAYHKQY